MLIDDAFVQTCGMEDQQPSMRQRHSVISLSRSNAAASRTVRKTGGPLSCASGGSRRGLGVDAVWPITQTQIHAAFTENRGFAGDFLVKLVQGS